MDATRVVREVCVSIMFASAAYSLSTVILVDSVEDQVYCFCVIDIRIIRVRPWLMSLELSKEVLDLGSVFAFTSVSSSGQLC